LQSDAEDSVDSRIFRARKARSAERVQQSQSGGSEIDGTRNPKWCIVRSHDPSTTSTSAALQAADCLATQCDLIRYLRSSCSSTSTNQILYWSSSQQGYICRTRPKARAVPLTALSLTKPDEFGSIVWRDNVSQKASCTRRSRHKQTSKMGV
jgi:hypothetical protein